MKLDSFWKKTFFIFVLIQAGITLAMGIIGMVFMNGEQVPYIAFFFPFFFAALCLLPEFIFYLKKEPSIRELLMQKVVKLMMLAVIVLGMQKLLSPTSSLKLMVAIGVSVTIIAIFIQVVSWRYEEGEAETMNQKLREYRERRK